MLFWNLLSRHATQVALNDVRFGDVSFAELDREADEWAARLAAHARRIGSSTGKLLVGIEIEARSPIITAYLGALMGGHPVILAEPGGLSKDSAIARRYRPNLILSMQGDECRVTEACSEEAELHPELALLLSTSGSTGDPRLVRLSRDALDSNARAISEYLGLTSADKAVTSLPLHYSYGLSVLHSHLAVGASIVLVDGSVADPQFKARTNAEGVTSLALVPHQIDLLHGRKIGIREFGAIRYVTQAGGRLGSARVKELALQARREGWEFFVMYGQTEAGPRIAYVPPAALAANADTIGRAIPGGRIWIADAQGAEVLQPGISGELVYEGPNVMFGYADQREDLARGREMTSLHTGDIAERTSVRANTDQEPVAQPKLCCASFAQLAAGCSPALIVNEAVIGARSRREGPPMTTRITKSIVTFDHAFALGQYSDILPAGDYEVVLEEERLQGPSFEAYRRSATYLTVTDKIGRNAGRTELRPITERDLEIALSGDRALTLGGQEGKEPFQSQEDLP